MSGGGVMLGNWLMQPWRLASAESAAQAGDLGGSCSSQLRAVCWQKPLVFQESQVFSIKVFNLLGEAHHITAGDPLYSESPDLHIALV